MHISLLNDYFALSSVYVMAMWDPQTHLGETEIFYKRKRTLIIEK